MFVVVEGIHNICGSLVRVVLDGGVEIVDTFRRFDNRFSHRSGVVDFEDFLECGDKFLSIMKMGVITDAASYDEGQTQSQTSSSSPESSTGRGIFCEDGSEELPPFVDVEVDVGKDSNSASNSRRAGSVALCTLRSFVAAAEGFTAAIAGSPAICNFGRDLLRIFVRPFLA